MWHMMLLPSIKVFKVKLHKHAEPGIHWLKGGKIDQNYEADAPEDNPGWKLWDTHNCPSFNDEFSYRIHDPYRELKKRFECGYTIQRKHRVIGTEWIDCVFRPAWIDAFEYREKPPSKRKIDWSKMPCDTVISDSDGNVWRTSGSVDKEGNPYVWAFGRSAVTATDSKVESLIGKKIQLVSQEWVAWFGGNCPVPEGVRFEVVLRDGSRFLNIGNDYWNYGAIVSSQNIIAYRILGVSEGWEE